MSDYRNEYKVDFSGRSFVDFSDKFLYLGYLVFFAYILVRSWSEKESEDYSLG